MHALASLARHADSPVTAAALQGYGADSGVPLPEDHPPVARHGDAGQEEVVPGVRVQVLAVYHNGTIWTADPTVRGQPVRQCEATTRPAPSFL